MMETFPWILAAVFAALALFFAFRGRGGSGAGGPSLEKLFAEVRSGKVSAEPPPGEAAEVTKLRRVLAESRAPSGGQADAAGAGDEALGRIARYLQEAVVRPLEAARGDGRRMGEVVSEALDALADLEFFTRERNEEVRADNLTAAVQSVTREFALEYAVSVKLTGAERPIRARFASESLKDAIYLLLVNGARFGQEQAVEVVVEEGKEGPRVRILDQGPGFSREALAKATEPFFTTERDSLGLGLTHARQVVEGVGGRIRIRNREGGGAEVELLLPPPS